ncbi:MAG: phosphatase PAP2 family protein [Chitinophagaceae bacterium]|nr:MAG: membrane-associated phospholipid phosphatase [Bacteroidetes bacterium OLB11]MCC6448895.1 phosphatase PAP2 family protein [Chitinophagaceae bacterium]HMN33588.1 phosphatase PAP2 family protein [Chitinophagaceae bacterium]
MLETIKHIDFLLFKWVHVGMSNSLFDIVMPFIRIPYFWAPVYLFLLVWMWTQFRYKGLFWCFCFFITFVFCDYISASVIKNLVQRVRPCNDESLQYLIRRIVHCGSGYSFPSSHAANHFGLSFFIIFTLKNQGKWVVPLALTWALLICFAQVYVGVHYPFDILGGAILGIMIAKLISTYFNLKINKWESQGVE